jgi:hypothetical protein
MWCQIDFSGFFFFPSVHAKDNNENKEKIGKSKT